MTVVGREHDIRRFVTEILVAALNSLLFAAGVLKANVDPPPPALFSARILPP